ncbi:MAG: smalltalk protein [Bacteroides sp.]|nr:smalltalk protein [Bacteroides sp.]
MSNETTNNSKSIWGKIIQIVITILTAIATTFGVTSCMGI